MQVRAGIHTGEVETINGKVGGIAVNIGARVAAKAGASRVLVSQTVKDLVAGSGLAFEYSGAFGGWGDGEHRAVVVAEVVDGAGEHRGLAGSGWADDDHERVVLGDRSGGFGLTLVESTLSHGG